MILTEKQTNKELIEKTIEYLKGQGYDNIKADIQGYESPKSFKMKSKGIELTPDIVAESNGKVQYVEVGIKTDDTSLLKTKWKFLDTISQIKNRGFRIVSHHGHYGFTDQIIDEINLNKTAVRI